MNRAREWLATPEARWIVAIFVLAFMLRLAWVGVVHPSPRDGRPRNVALDPGRAASLLEFRLSPIGRSA